MIIKILIFETATVKVSDIDQELNRSGYDFKVLTIESIDEFQYALQEAEPNIILSGYSLIDTSAKRALKIRNKHHPQIPFIFITDDLALENCIDLIRKGLSDIVFKQNISSLADKITRALKKIPAFKKNKASNAIERDATTVVKKSKKEITIQAILENSSEGNLLTALDGNVLSANNTACKMFQMTFEELITHDKFSLVDLTDTNLEKLLKERNETGRCKGELRFLRKDGTVFPAVISSVIFRDNCGNSRSSITIRDLSDYKNSQRQLATTTGELQQVVSDLHKILESSQDVICTVNAKGTFININSACKNLWGYEPYELIGHNYLEIVYEQDHEISLDANREIFSGIPITLFENRLVHKEGHIVYTIWSAKWDHDEQLIYCTAKDISEQKKLEKAGLVERQRFMDIYSQSPSLIAVLKGPDHVYELANPLYLNLINKEDIIGKRVIDVLPELNSQGVFELLDTVYSTGKPYTTDEMLFRFDSQSNGNFEDKYLNILYQAHRDSDNKIDGILFFATDVTEQVLSRMKIEESEKLYKKLIRELPVATYSCDADGKIKIYNKAAATLWGREPEIGINFGDAAWRILDMEGNSIPSNLCPMTTALKEGRTISGMEIIIERENGERRYVIPHAVPYTDASGKITGAVNMLTDITESKAAQKVLELQNLELANYKYALDESSIVGITDQKGKIIYANHNFCKISKYELEEVIGKDHRILSSGYHSKEYISNLWRTISAGKTWKGELQNRAKDGTIYWVDTTITPFLNEQGKPYQFVATRFDITERKKAELDLEMQNKELLKTNKELDRFVYSVSHDLRSPLTSVQGLVSIIEDESKEPETLEHVKMIKSSINRLDEFIRKILSYSQNNRTELDLETFPIKKNISDVINSLQNMVHAKGIVFEIDIKEQTPFCSDRVRFNTIVENLISNAIKYHKLLNSDRIIQVKGTVDQKKLQLKIADNGIGIAEKYQHKIFDMFYRVSSISDGSGIGLYIVKETVEKLEGSITVHSQINCGTTFEITLKNFN